MEQRTLRDEIELDLKEIVRVILSKLWFIILMGVLVGLAMLIYTKYMVAPLYSSTTKVYVLNRQNTNANVNYTDLQTGAQLTKDYMELVKSRTILTQVITELDLDMSVEALAGMVTVSSPQDTRVVALTVTSTDVYLAQKIANELRDISATHIREIMNLEAINTVEEANIPVGPSSPSIVRNAMMGGIFGVLIGMTIIIAMYLLDDSIRTPDDVERYLNVSVLASIPILENENKKKKKRLVSEISPEEMEQEEFEDFEEDEEDI